MSDNGGSGGGNSCGDDGGTYGGKLLSGNIREGGREKSEGGGVAGDAIPPHERKCQSMNVTP